VNGHSDEHFPIREFARLTGVNPATLRAWERRYGIIKPFRTPKGHRYYGLSQVDTIKQVLYWLDKGYPIRQVKSLLQRPDVSLTSSGPANDEWLHQQQALLTAANAFNQRGFDDLINNGFAHYPVAVYYQFCLVPVLHQLRSEKASGLVLRIFLQWLNRKLDAILQHQQRHNQGTPLIIVASHVASISPNDARCECLIRACALGAAGIRVDYFDGDVDPTELALLADKMHAYTVWLHFHPGSGAGWSSYLANAEQQADIPHLLSGQIPDESSFSTATLSTPTLSSPASSSPASSTPASSFSARFTSLTQPLQQQIQYVVHNLQGGASASLPSVSPAAEKKTAEKNTTEDDHPCPQ